MKKALFFLGVLNDEDVDWMIAAGRTRRLATDAVLVQEGRPLDAVYIVLDGSFAVTAASARGSVVARLAAGEFVGEMSFVDSRPPSATVTALEPSSVLEVPRTPLADRLREPPFAARFYHALALFLADRVRSTTSLFAYGASLPVAPASNEDDIDPDVLQRVGIAGARFEWMLKRLQDQ